MTLLRLSHITQQAICYITICAWQSFCICAFVCIGGFYILHGSESSLEDPLDSSSTTQILEAQIPTQESTPSSTSRKRNQGIMQTATEVGSIDDFTAVQKRYPWIRSVGLIMVSFDDGSFRSGFGLLLPQNLFLTSAELGRNANAYPKHILLKMRDEDALQLICIAELRLKAMDKEQGLSLFEVSGYTDDYCNLRSQSYYHHVLLTRNAYNLLHSDFSSATHFYTVTTTFNNPSISVLTLAPGDRRVPITHAQTFVYGRPFFSESGQFLGMTTLPGHAISPIIISPREIRGFLCGVQKSGFYISSFVQEFCDMRL